MTAIRSFPADTKLQSFYTQNYDKENGARLQWYIDNKRGQAGGQKSRQGSRSAINHGLPQINPMEFARNKKREEDERIKQIRIQARKQQSKEEMRDPNPKLFAKLYDGFTKEEKGRYEYLQERHKEIPEKKFTFPMLSSMEYGWKLDDNFSLKRPRNARTRLVKDTFYTRNQVPDLGDPTTGECLERGYTMA